MAYNLMITEHANEQVEQTLCYLINHLCNPDAAAALLDDLDIAYRTLEQTGASFALCSDPYLGSSTSLSRSFR